MENNKPIRIALVEDNSISRKSFLQKAQLIPAWEIIFTANNSDYCLTQLKDLRTEMLPLLIFMDIEMPGVNGIQTIAIAKAIYPDIYFVVLTVFDDDEKIFEAIKSGACGYLLKHEDHAVLRDAVTNVLEYGGSPMSPAIARKTLQLLSRSTDIDRQKPETIPDSLTAREKEILEFTVKGWDAKRIAVKLAISALTVRKHIANIYTKLHIQSRAEMIHMAHKNNWLM